jgi:hypothetical protein
VPRPRSYSRLLDGLFWSALGALGLALGADTALSGLALVGGVLRVVLAFVLAPPRPSVAVDGPHPLRATGTGRLRATGWPPSKNPDDYR